MLICLLVSLMSPLGPLGTVLDHIYRGAGGPSWEALLGSMIERWPKEKHAEGSLCQIFTFLDIF